MCYHTVRPYLPEALNFVSADPPNSLSPLQNVNGSALAQAQSSALHATVFKIRVRAHDVGGSPLRIRGGGPDQDLLTSPRMRD